MNYLFWNIKGKNLVSELVDLVSEHSIDILAVAEAEKLDCTYLTEKLIDRGIYYQLNKIEEDKENGIRLFSKKEICVSSYKEDNHYSVFKIHKNEKIYLYIVVHLTSACNKSEDARISRASNASKIFEKIEESVYEENEFRTIIVGDFNLQPFSRGIIGAFSFNATLSAVRARAKKRTVDFTPRLFYYNPTWKVMAKKEEALGSYYCESDDDDNSFYWYMFDQVLIRPAVIDVFDMSKFEILHTIGEKSLIKNNKIDSNKYSDHLPIKFVIE